MKKGNIIILIAVCAIAVIGAGIGYYIKSSSGLDSYMSAVMSESMQHDNYHSSIGVIDTGDVIISYSKDKTEIHTYIGSYTGDKYKSFGDYGSVITYVTVNNTNPIIHRAIVELEWNSEKKCWQSPELENYEYWYVESSSGVKTKDCMNLKGTLHFTDLTQSHKEVTIALSKLDTTVDGKNCKGYLTLGDNPETNTSFDQPLKITHPVTASEIKSVAMYEIPWWGIFKVMQDSSKKSNLSHVPNSITSIIMLVVMIFTIIFVIDVFNMFYKLHVKEKNRRC